MQQILNLFDDILANGHDHADRTGVGRRSVFGRELRFNLADGFPLVTTRKVFAYGFIQEMLWFLSGSCNALELEAKRVNIWKAWTPTQADADVFAEKLSKPNGLNALPPAVRAAICSEFLDLPHDEPDVLDAIKALFAPRVGTIGPMYGAIWRGHYPVYGTDANAPDQIAALVEGLKTNPWGSRHCVSAHLPEFLPLPNFSPKENVLLGRGALAPCHCFFQCFVSPPANDTSTQLRLSLKLEVRSSDTAVGLPYNVAQYALLLFMLARCTGMEAHELIVSIGDAHVYLDQIELVKEQLTREPRELPDLLIKPGVDDIFGFYAEDFMLSDYNPHAVIKYPVAT